MPLSPTDGAAASFGHPASPTLGDRTWVANAQIQGDLKIDPDTRRAFVAGRELPVTTQLFDLLAFFMARRGTAVSFEELASEVWGYPYGDGDRHFLHTAVYRLRRILNDAGVDDLIEGIRGFGYRISATPDLLPRPVEANGTAPRAIMVIDPLDPGLRISMVNDAALELSGYELAELTNLPQGADEPIWMPEERAIVLRAVQEAMASGTPTSTGRQILRADGETITVDLSLSRINCATGGPLCIAELHLSDR